MLTFSEMEPVEEANPETMFKNVIRNELPFTFISGPLKYAQNCFK